ncbi:SDR family NAD(P)-dependent oxidoreductase, partial [bacterium]
MELKDKYAVVTGGAQGIGKEIALTLAEAGCNVCITDINEEL